MVLLTGLFWSAVGAAVVALLVEGQERRDVAAVLRGESLEVRTGSPGMAFVVSLLFLVAAPFILGHARGTRGFLEGSAIVVVVFVLNVTSLVGLVLVRGH